MTEVGFELEYVGWLGECVAWELVIVGEEG